MKTNTKQSEHMESGRPMSPGGRTDTDRWQRERAISQRRPYLNRVSMVKLATAILGSPQKRELWPKLDNVWGCGKSCLGLGLPELKKKKNAHSSLHLK